MKLRRFAPFGVSIGSACATRRAVELGLHSESQAVNPEGSITSKLSVCERTAYAHTKVVSLSRTCRVDEKSRRTFPFLSESFMSFSRFTTDNNSRFISIHESHLHVLWQHLREFSQDIHEILHSRSSVSTSSEPLDRASLDPETERVRVPRQSRVCL